MVVAVGIEPTRHKSAIGYQPIPLSNQANYDYIKSWNFQEELNMYINTEDGKQIEIDDSNK